jgi:hypothetical protein
MVTFNGVYFEKVKIFRNFSANHKNKNLVQKMVKIWCKKWLKFGAKNG